MNELRTGRESLNAKSDTPPSRPSWRASEFAVQRLYIAQEGKERRSDFWTEVGAYDQWFELIANGDTLERAVGELDVDLNTGIGVRIFTA